MIKTNSCPQKTINADKEVYAPDIEVYLNPDPQNAQYKIWIPVVKKKG